MNVMDLSLDLLRTEAAAFADAESKHPNPDLYGVTDGKAIGTYFEQKFKAHLAAKYTFEIGNSASGIDLPSVNVDIKVTSDAQPQSSSPFRSARQKIFGLGYGLLVFVYDKTDNPKTKSANLNIVHVIFIEDSRTADFQMTSGLRAIIDNDGNEEDIIAFLQDKHLPVDDIEATAIAKELLTRKPAQGYITISNALQWRLQYRRAINKAGTVDGVIKVR